MNVQILEGCLTDKIDREAINIVEAVENRIQNAIFTSIYNLVTSRIELAVRSINGFSGLDAARDTADSEHGERIGIGASFENVYGRNNTFYDLNENDETRGNIPDQVAEILVPKTYFDQQTHTLITAAEPEIPFYSNQLQFLVPIFRFRYRRGMEEVSMDS